jgi:hypothetical protein
VVESSDGAGFAPEALQPLRARGHLDRQHLERDLAPELRVRRAVDRAIPPVPIAAVMR